ncbi:MAG: hypothetical protein PVI86_13270, partial [Phycisphaerae bacterium]
RFIVNQGTIRSNVSGHTIELRGGGVTNEGTIEARNGGAIVASGFTPRNWTNEASMYVGAGSSFTVTPDGSNMTTFEQTAAGSLTIELGGVDQVDRALVSLDEPMLGGTLNLVLVDGFAPPVGTTFTAVEYTSAAGNFATITGLDIGNGTHFQATSTADGLVLEVVPG